MHEPEPEVVMKIPRKSIQEDSGVVPEAKETVVLPPNRLEEKKARNSNRAQFLIRCLNRSLKTRNNLVQLQKMKNLKLRKK